MPKISVIIPVYNNEKYVKKCIESVLNQSMRDFEIIIVNDGSTDQSAEILKNLECEDERIRLIHQENQGVAAARNNGIAKAAGTYLTFVDGDDYIDEQYLEKMLYCIEEHQADMVICGLTFVDENGLVEKRVIPGEYSRFEKEEWTFRISAVCSHLYRRELWEKYDVRFQSGERGEDMPISLFFSAVCDKIITLPEAGYFYVQHKSSAIHNFRGLRMYSLPYQALENMIKKVREVGLKNSPDFYELFVLRILATCFFALSPGASREKMKELSDYIVRILQTYFPNYARNSKIHLYAKIDVPFVQKAAVLFLVFLVKTRLIYPCSVLMSRAVKN